MDFPEFTESELKAIALRFPCRVELFHSNVCHGIERSWPQRMFGRANYHELLAYQKEILTKTMIKNAVKLYNEFVNEDRLKKRNKRQTYNTLCPYYEERYLKHRFYRIKALGDVENDAISSSECSMSTVIDNLQNTSTSTSISTSTSTSTSKDEQSLSAAQTHEDKIVYQTSSEEEDEDEVEAEYESDVTSYTVTRTLHQTIETNKIIYSSLHSIPHQREMCIDEMINYEFLNDNGNIPVFIDQSGEQLIVSYGCMDPIEISDESDESDTYINYVENTIEIESEPNDIVTPICRTPSINRFLT